MSELLNTKHQHIESLDVAPDGLVALATSSLTGEVWDGRLVVLRCAADAARAEVLNLGEMLLRECKSRVSKMEAESMAQAQAAASPETGGASPESKAKTTGQVDYCGLKVDAKTLTMRKNDMRFLSKHISKVAKERALSKGLTEDKGLLHASMAEATQFAI